MKLKISHEPKQNNPLFTIWSRHYKVMCLVISQLKKERFVWVSQPQEKIIQYFVKSTNDYFMRYSWKCSDLASSIIKQCTKFRTMGIPAYIISSSGSWKMFFKYMTQSCQEAALYTLYFDSAKAQAEPHRLGATKVAAMMLGCRFLPSSSNEFMPPFSVMNWIWLEICHCFQGKTKEKKKERRERGMEGGRRKKGNNVKEAKLLPLFSFPR